MTGSKQKVSASKPVRRRRLSWRAYLLLLLFFAFLVLALIIVSAARWQNTLRDCGIGSMPADPSLNFPQRFYLQNYLTNHADELRRPSGDIGEMQFEIAPGATADTVVDDLNNTGLVNNMPLFLNYIRYFGLDSALQSGNFTLNGQLTIPQLAAAISDGSGRNITVNFFPGMRLEEMIHYLTVTMPAKIDPEEFQDLVQRRQRFSVDHYSFLNSLPPDASLEGFLYPDSYILPPDANAVFLVDHMLQNFDRQITPAMRQAYGAQGLSLLEAVTVASIVERETMTDEERPLIASVFLNRVHSGMPLQADPTVQYAAGYQQSNNSWWKVPLSLADLEYNHPYNTYIIPGLPPGPIASPGINSLNAVAEPADTNYLFFVVDCYADPEGRHVFSQTYEEHLAHVQKCQ